MGPRRSESNAPTAALGAHLLLPDHRAPPGGTRPTWTHARMTYLLPLYRLVARGGRVAARLPVDTPLQVVGEQLCESLGVRAGERVLDVAAGTGHVSIAAARRRCSVVSTEAAPYLLARVHTEGLQVELHEGNADELPFRNGSFDVVTSAFGLMLVPDPDRVAAELMRVCRPGGRIGLASWTSAGFLGQLASVMEAHVREWNDMLSPNWGVRTWLSTTFSPRAVYIRQEPRCFTFRSKSPERMLDHFLRILCDAGDADRVSTSLSGALLELILRSNRAKDGTAVVPSEYLEAVIALR